MTDEQYLRKLIEEGEHDQQDFKYKIQEAAKLARSVSAFANTRGGRLLIGVRDDGHISGVKSEEEIFMMHAAAFKYCTPESAIRFDTLHVEGRSVVIATIPPAQRKPIKAIDEEGTPHAYVRIKDENILATPVHLRVWQQSGSPKGELIEYTEREQLLLNLLEENERASNQMEYGETAQQMMRALAEHPGETLNRLVRLSQVNRRASITLLARFVRYGLAEMRLEDHQFHFYPVE